MKKIYSINNIWNIEIPFKKPSLIFLKWDLASGKTTLVKSLIKKLWVREEITSPTYTYYNQYTANSQQLTDDSQLKADNWKLTTIYHFDLYRLKDYDEFFAIWWEDILDNNFGIIFVEWPEIIEKYYKADFEIFLKKTDKNNEREIKIITND